MPATKNTCRLVQSNTSIYDFPGLLFEKINYTCLQNIDKTDLSSSIVSFNYIFILIRLDLTSLYKGPGSASTLHSRYIVSPPSTFF